MINQKTVVSLISSGFSSEQAEKLYNQGFSITRLRALPVESLKELGISSEQIAILRNSSRPPIPINTVRSLLYESKYCCCVCRDKSQPIVIHHIVPWEKCRTHDISNLVVLCLNHHNEAHTTHQNSLNLTTDKIRHFKETWLKAVRDEDKQALLSLIGSGYTCWDYFNLHRIFEISNCIIPHFDLFAHFDRLFKAGVISQDGMPILMESHNKAKSSLYYDFPLRLCMESYIREIFMLILRNSSFINLNKIWSKEQMKRICKIQDFIFLQGAFYFKDDRQDNDQVKLRLGYRKAKGIKLSFTFDPWYCLSISSKYTHLTGRSVVTVFGIIRDISITTEGELHIKCSVLAIGTGLDEIPEGRNFDIPSGYEIEDDYDDGLDF